ncbi:MAG TPA: tetratricopeptide repeat protein [Candidatus Cybelea sp.]|nr:tetratricopeptide repeat protein [Candidatus Cybelea sp.]
MRVRESSHRAQRSSAILAVLAAAFLLTGRGPLAQVRAQTAPAGGPASETRGAFEVTSELGRKLYAEPDDGTILAAEKKLSADPKNAKLVLALSGAQAGRRQYREAVRTCTKGLVFLPDNPDLLIERGHRELGLRQFALAQRDLDRAAALDPKKIDAFYHLGLAHYFQGQFDQAADAFRIALRLAANNNSVIDSTNWLYVSLRRAKKDSEAAQVLQKITPQVQNTEPHYGFYLRLLHFYQGMLSELETLPPRPKSPSDTESELAFDTVGYGVGNWHLCAGDLGRPSELFEEVVSGNAWNAWGFVGSEVELAGRKAARSR